MAKAKYTDPSYRQALAYWTPRMRLEPWTCRRCGKPIPPGDRAAWDLGHPEPFEPEHRGCNRQAGARLGNAIRRQPASQDW